MTKQEKFELKHNPSTLNQSEKTMNQSALNAFLQELKTSINKLESVLTNQQEPVKDCSLWFPPADKNYGPWITHSGNIPPVPYGTKIQRLSHAERHDRRFTARSEESCSDLWHNGIVAYRLKKEQPFVFVPEEEYEEYDEEYDEDEDRPVAKKKPASKVAAKQAIRKKLWYPADYVFGPWTETKGKDFHLPTDTKIQILTKDARDNKRSGKNPSICVYSHVKDPACTPSYKDIVAYRIVTEQQ